MQRKSLLAAAVAVGVIFGAVGVVSPTPATAQTVYCTNCASQWTQLKQQADQALQLVRQAEQLQVQMQSYEQMMKDGLELPSSLFGDVARDLSAINGVMERAQGLAYTASNLDEQFAQRYGSFEGYRQSGVSDAQLQDKYRQWSQESRSSVLTTMQALGAQSRDMSNEAAMLRQLQTRAGNAQGQMQAISVGNELAAESIAQMQRLRQLVMMQTQLQAQAMQLDADRDAIGAARAAEFFRSSGPDYAGNTY
jgi:P-type conjugative transfer protein TrbJ